MIILNLGAGVQSTTVLLMSHKGFLPQIHHAIFADTKAEPQSVYKHLEWLKSEVKIPIHVISAGNLETDLINSFASPDTPPTTGRKGFARIPLFIDNGPGYNGDLLAQRYTREDCVAWLKENYPDISVPRSACYFCPFRNKDSWVQLKKNDPKDFEKAIKVDNIIRENNFFDGVPYLTRSLTPIEKIKETKDFGFEEEREGHCGV